MKIVPTNDIGTGRLIGTQNGEQSKTHTGHENKQESGHIKDTVQLSSEALSASRKMSVTSADEGPRAITLPDPGETSRAIIEKELELLFSDIYK